MATYKTKDGRDYILPGIGRTTKGQITTDALIENANFEIVEGHLEQAPTPAPAAQPAADATDSQSPAAPAQGNQAGPAAPTAPPTNQETT